VRIGDFAPTIPVAPADYELTGLSRDIAVVADAQTRAKRYGMARAG